MRQWLQEGKKGADTGDFKDVEWTELGHHWMWGGKNEEGIRLVGLGKPVEWRRHLPKSET